MGYNKMIGSRITPKEAAEMVWELTPEYRLRDTTETDFDDFIERWTDEDIHELELRKIPLLECLFGWTYVDADDAESYRKMYLDGEIDYPPILVTRTTQCGKKFCVEDGNHRCTAFKSIGLTHVYAYVPVDEALEPLPAMTPDLPFPD